MATKRKHSPTSKSRKTSATDSYIVRVMNVATGAQQDVQMLGSGRSIDYSLWPTFTLYVVGFGLLGMSFIAHTLRLYIVFAILLCLSAGVVIGTAVVRTLRRR